MLRRNLQSAGGIGGTLFSALMLVVIVICFITYCYRRSIYNFNNRARLDVEVIIETTADMCDSDANFAEVGVPSNQICQLESTSNTAHDAERLKNLLLWLNDSHGTTPNGPNALEIAIAYEYDMIGSASTTQARPMSVMESYQSPDSPYPRRMFNANAAPPSPSSEDFRPGAHDHDFLIETERNMFEFNSDFNRLASSNEAALAHVSDSEETLTDSRQLDSSDDIDETNTISPVRVTREVIRPGSTFERSARSAFLFYPQISPSRATLTGVRGAPQGTLTGIPTGRL